MTLNTPLHYLSVAMFLIFFFLFLFSLICVSHLMLCILVLLWPGISRCSGHGTFLYETCSCKCAEGWEGSDCSHPACPSHCSGHGRCDSGKCICDEPYFGEDCSHQLCPENCSGNGICDTAKGVCQCYEEFIGEDCSEKRCPEDCSGNGFCDTGECYCHDGFFGLDCSQGKTCLWVISPLFLSIRVSLSTSNKHLVNPVGKQSLGSPCSSRNSCWARGCWLVLVFKNCLENISELRKGGNTVKGSVSTSLCVAAEGESKNGYGALGSHSLFLDIQMRQ